MKFRFYELKYNHVVKVTILIRVLKKKKQFM